MLKDQTNLNFSVTSETAATNILLKDQIYENPSNNDAVQMA